MVLAAFQAYERGKAGASFAAVNVPVRSVGLSPFAPLSTDKPGPHKAQSDLTRGARAQVDTAIRSAFGAQQDAIRRHGLADRQTARLGDVISPADFILPGALMMTAVSALGYAMADRRSNNMSPPQHENDMSEEFRRVQWNRPGYHAAALPAGQDDAALTRADMDAILRPPEQDQRMRVLFGQRRHIGEAQANLRIREDKGLKPNAKTAAAAIMAGHTRWLVADAPVPHFV